MTEKKIWILQFSIYIVRNTIEVKPMKRHWTNWYKLNGAKTSLVQIKIVHDKSQRYHYW
jgi:hypothetical protein